MRWRVKRSVRTPTWFYACEVLFVDAADAVEAKQFAETSQSDWSFEAWDIVPATPAMEAQHHEMLRRNEEWRQRAATGEAARGLL